MEFFFEQYFQDLLKSIEEINYIKFLLNLLITAGLSSGLAIFYVRFGNAVANRRRFARNFLPLAMTTMLIIFIVKSSVALSLGLVGALSIVRFRSAIKDPEELTYLFLTIGIGLAAGADEILIAICAYAMIVAILFVQAWSRKSGVFSTTESMHLNISTQKNNLKEITEILTKIFPFVELKRIDETPVAPPKDAEAGTEEGKKAEKIKRLDLSYVIEAGNLDQIEAARNQLTNFDPAIRLSFIEQRNIAL